MDLLADLVELGHRYYGAPRRAEAIDRLADELERRGATVERRTFDVVERESGASYELTNLVARFRPTVSRRLLLGTHWDTRLWAEEDPDPARRDQPIPGANDGTSGVVVLLELLAAVERTGAFPELGIDIVLFDGEELGRPGSSDYSRGAREFAASLASAPSEERPLAAVVVDMVGQPGLRLRPEVASRVGSPRFVELAWSLGRAEFPEMFDETPVGPIHDDHVPLLRLGIPSLLLIDLDYDPWHTHADTPDQCSAESLERVARYLALLVANLEDPAWQPENVQS